MPEQTPRQKLDALIDNYTPKIRDAFKVAIQDVVDNAVLSTVIDAVEAGSPEAAFQALGFNQAAMRPLVAMIEEAYETGGVLTGETFPKILQTSNGKVVFRFDVRNIQAEAYLRDHSSQLITRLENEARANVQTVLQEGMKEGMNPRQTALNIIGRIDKTTGHRTGGVVGLTENQESWVNSARTKLQTLDSGYFDMELRDKRFDKTVARAISDGKPLDQETVQKLVDRYRDNALKLRGETIARTESMQALNQSEYEATRQAIDLGATKSSNVEGIWDSAGDTRVRPTHVAMDGQTVKWGEPFVSPSGSRLMHPGDVSLGADASEIINCRCRARWRVDWLADLD